MTATTNSPINATFTRLNNEWVIKTDRRLTKADFASEKRMVIGGAFEMLPVCRVQVALKSGATKVVEVAEYEKQIGGEHFYSVR